MKKEDKQPAKEIGVRTVAGWIFAVLGVLISIFSGVVTIKAGQIIVGVLFLIFGAFAILPRKYVRISRPLKVIIFIAAYFTLLIISGLNAPKPEQQYEYYNLGQPFNLTFDKEIFSMKINNVSKETQITVNDGQTLSSSGFYLFVNGEITNLGKVPSDLQFSSELKDGEDNLYTLLATDTRVGEFQPNLEKKFYNVFEIPKQAAGLKFFVKDKTSIIKVVSLE